MNHTNLFYDIERADEEISEQLFTAPGIRIERIMSFGQTSELYEQEEHEWVAVLEGEAEILFVDENRHMTLRSGDHLFIPAKLRHQVTRTSDPCRWLCVFWDECATL